jgi:hypothetical protein
VSETVQEDTQPSSANRSTGRWTAPDAAWDLDNMPQGLKSLAVPGRTVAPARPAPGVDYEDSGLMQMAAMLATPFTGEREGDTRVSTNRLRSGANGGWLQQTQQLWRTLRAGVLGQGRKPSQRPQLLMSGTVTALFVGVGCLVGWAVSGTSITSPPAALAATQPPSPTLSHGSSSAPASAPSVENTALGAPAAHVAAQMPDATAGAATTVAALTVNPGRGRAAADDEPTAAPPPSGDTLDGAKRLMPARAGAHDLSVLPDNGPLVREHTRAERLAAAKLARKNNARARWLAKQKHGSRRVSARVAGVGRSGRKSLARAAAPDDSEDSVADQAVEPAKTPAARDASLDDLVEGALAGKPRAPRRDPLLEPESDLPETPTRDQMLAALGKAKSLVSKCEGGGTVTASISIKGPTGRVVDVDVEGASGSARSCVESAIRRTPFPKFQQQNFAVRAPFKLQET